MLSWSIGDGQAFRASLGGAAARLATIRRYANVRHLLNYLQGMVFGTVLMINLLLPISGLTSVVIASDLVTVVALTVFRRSRGLSWGDFLFGLHSTPYSMVRHGGFLIGFIHPPRDPREYPTGETVLQISPPAS